MGNICYCGKPKRRERLTCPRCFELYRDDIKKREEKPSFITWVKERALEKLTELGASETSPLTTLEKDLMAKKEELQNLRAKLPTEVSFALGQQLAGAGQLRPDEVEALRRDTGKDLWNQMGGNRLFAELKTLEKEKEEKVVPIRQTLEEIAKIEKDQSSAARLIEAVFPDKDK